MTSYTKVFGGNAVRPADQSLTALALTGNVTLSWPVDGGSPSTSAIVEVTPDVGGWTINMPDARNAGNGETVTFKNYGSVSFSVADNAGGSIVTIGAGLVYTVYLRSNTTAAGSWAYWQSGASTSVADAGALQGPGLDALSGVLRVKATALSYSASQAFSDSNRGSIATWTGGSGTFSMPRADSVGNGWFMIFKNAGSGTLQIAPSNSETFDGGADITLAAAEGATVFSNGTNFSFVKHGSSTTGTSFSYTAIAVAGTGTYTLSAAEYAKKAISFTGLLTGNRTIIVPTAVQDYWITNNTTGSFTLTVKTASGTGVVVTQGKAQTMYCDGVNVVAANTDYPAGLSTPISVANGGTGATTSATALTNLGGTATGTSLFTAASAASARSSLSAAGSGANTDISSLYLNNTGLKIKDTDASHGLIIAPGSNITADRTLTITTGDAARTIDISAGSVTITAAGAALTAGATAAAQRTTLGLGTLATLSTITTTELTNSAVTYAKIQNVSATSRVLGRKTAGAGVAEELTFSDILDFVGSAAQGDILYRGATTWTRLGAGTAGQVLQTGGAAANPSWTTLPTGGWTQASSVSLAQNTVANIPITGIPSTAKSVIIMLDGAYQAAGLVGGWATWFIQVGSGSVTTTGYNGYASTQTGTGSSIRSDVATNGVPVLVNSTNQPVYGSIRLNNITGNTWVIDYSFGGVAGTTYYTHIGGGSIALAGALDRVNLNSTGVSGSRWTGGTMNVLYQ